MIKVNSVLVDYDQFVLAAVKPDDFISGEFRRVTALEYKLVPAWYALEKNLLIVTVSILPVERHGKELIAKVENISEYYSLNGIHLEDLRADRSLPPRSIVSEGCPPTSQSVDFYMSRAVGMHTKFAEPDPENRFVSYHQGGSAFMVSSDDHLDMIFPVTSIPQKWERGVRDILFATTQAPTWESADLDDTPPKIHKDIILTSRAIK